MGPIRVLSDAVENPSDKTPTNRIPSPIPDVRLEQFDSQPLCHRTKLGFRSRSFKPSCQRKRRRHARPRRPCSLLLARSPALLYITKISHSHRTSIVTRISTGVSDTRLGTHVSTRTAETRVFRTVGAVPPPGPTGVREPPVDLPVHPEQRASQTTPAEDQRSGRQTHLTSL